GAGRWGRCGASVAGIRAKEEIARLDVLVVLDEELGDIAHDLRTDHGHGALDIGIVGRDVAAGMPPGPATVEEPREGDEGGGADDDPPSLVGYAVHAGLALREGLPTSIDYCLRSSRLLRSRSDCSRFLRAAMCCGSISSTAFHSAMASGSLSSRQYR